MRNSCAVLLAVALMLLGTVGCDQQPQGESNLTEALQIINRAESGFVPEDVIKQGEVDLQAYRQQTLDEAIPKLEQIVNAPAEEVSPAQQVAARRLLSDIHAAYAHYLTREAGGEYASLAPRSAGLLTHLEAVEKAMDRSALFQNDTGSLLEQFEATIAEQKAKQSSLRSQAAALSKQIDSLKAQQTEQQRQADAAAAEAERLRREAFVAEGEAHYTLLDRAAEADRRSDRFGVEAAKLGAQLDVLGSELEVLQAQITLVGEALEQLAEQVKQTEQRRQEAREKVAAIENQRVAAVEALVTEFEQLQETFETSVSQPLTTATERIDRAVALLEQAVNQAQDAQERQVVQLELLSQRAEQAHVYTEYAMALEGYGRIVEVLAGRAQVVLPEQAERLEEVWRQLVDRQAQVIEAGQIAVAAGRELATSLSGVDSEIEQQNAHLEGYRDRLTASALGGS